jgi:hypothetical protein
MNTTDNLYDAVEKWLGKRGGSALVAGGVEILSTGESPHNFVVGVRVTGKKPDKDKVKQANEEER